MELSICRMNREEREMSIHSMTEQIVTEHLCSRDPVLIKTTLSTCFPPCLVQTLCSLRPWLADPFPKTPTPSLLLKHFGM